jgi:hypothetical protein
MSQLMYGTLNQTDKGRRWAALNATIGTPVAGPADNVTTPTETVALLSLYNNSGAGLASGVVPPGRNLVPDYIKLIVGTAGTGAAGKLAVAIDTAPRGMGAADLNVQKGNADSDSIGDAAQNTNAASSISILRFGALTPLTATSKRKFVSIDYLFSRTLVAGDEVFVTFGQEANLSAPVATASRIQVPIGFTTLGPGGLLLIHLYGFSVAPTFELEAGWWELS